MGWFSLFDLSQGSLGIDILDCEIDQEETNQVTNKYQHSKKVTSQIFLVLLVLKVNSGLSLIIWILIILIASSQLYIEVVILHNPSLPVRPVSSIIYKVVQVNNNIRSHANSVYVEHVVADVAHYDLILDSRLRVRVLV